MYIATAHFNILGYLYCEWWNAAPCEGVYISLKQKIKMKIDFIVDWQNIIVAAYNNIHIGWQSIYYYCYYCGVVYQWLKTGFGLVSGFIDHLLHYLQSLHAELKWN
jgi:hypothetical protein